MIVKEIRLAKRASFQSTLKRRYDQRRSVGPKNNSALLGKIYVLPRPKMRRSRKTISKQKMDLKRPGLVFRAEPMTRMSSSHYGAKYEEFPVRNETYIVCQDGTIQARHDPERCILWELIEEENGWSDGQGNPLMVGFVGWETSVPKGRGSDSVNAFIIDFSDDGEPEVSS